ncbi:hypothetical protein B1810_05970 [Panacagrimonas perspica]|nr:hypothetical protein B1810_05970 [Panacagrimonas perspica]
MDSAPAVPDAASTHAAGIPLAGPPPRRIRAVIWRVLIILFFTGVATLIFARARQVDWEAVGDALAGYTAFELGLAFVAAALGHLCSGSYDLIGRWYTGHFMPRRRVFAINAIAYAFSLNLGALVGGWAFRVRLYTRFGLPVAVVARIIVLAVVTNWSGFTLLAGLLLLFWPPALPEAWNIPVVAIRGVGVLMLAIIGAYLAACVIGRRRGWTCRVRGQQMRMPTLPMAAAQLSLSSVSWLLMTVSLWMLLPAHLTFVRVIEALFACSIAGAALHVPGNVGVLEGSFTTLMATDLDEVQALAGILAFRAVYFLVPFAAAAVGYGFMEVFARRHRKTKG